MPELCRSPSCLQHTEFVENKKTLRTRMVYFEDSEAAWINFVAILNNKKLCRSCLSRQTLYLWCWLWDSGLGISEMPYCHRLDTTWPLLRLNLLLPRLVLPTFIQGNRQTMIALPQVDRAWLWKYYTYRIQVYDVWTLKVQTFHTTDPYSRSLAADGARTQVCFRSAPKSRRSRLREDSRTSEGVSLCLA